MKDIKDLAPFCIPITRDLRDEDIGEVLDECVMRGDTPQGAAFNNGVVKFH